MELFRGCELHVPTCYDNWFTFHSDKELHWSIFLGTGDVLLVLLLAVVMMHVCLSLRKYLHSAALRSRRLWPPLSRPRLSCFMFLCLSGWKMCRFNGLNSASVCQAGSALLFQLCSSLTLHHNNPVNISGCVNVLWPRLHIMKVQQTAKSLLRSVFILSAPFRAAAVSFREFFPWRKRDYPLWFIC